MTATPLILRNSKARDSGEVPGESPRRNSSNALRPFESDRRSVPGRPTAEYHHRSCFGASVSPPICRLAARGSLSEALRPGFRSNPRNGFPLAIAGWPTVLERYFGLSRASNSRNELARKQTKLRQDPAPSVGASDKGKPGESLGRKATELPRLIRAAMSAGQPNYPDGGEMLSCTRTMLLTTAFCSMLAGCDSAQLDPAAAKDVNASISSLRAFSGPVSLTIPDSALAIGDTTRLQASARNVRTNRDVTREIRFSFVSSDTSVAFVDKRGLVSAKRAGTAKLSVRSALGSAFVRIAVGGAAPTESPVASNTPAQPAPDTQSTARVPDAPAQASGALPLINTPTLPASTIGVAVPSVSGRSIRVPAGDAVALQNALNAAAGGDEIVLPNGAVYVGNFFLPIHAGASPVLFRSETVSAAAGTRISPAQAAGLARLVTANSDAAISTRPGAKGWWISGINLTLKAGVSDNYGVVRIGTGTETALTQFASDIVLDRVYVSGGESGNTSRCIALNGNALAVINSWLADCHAKGRDAQGIGSWTGIGPFLIQNNHIEGSGQNIMFGGADPAVSGVSPSDITIRGNHLYKPLTWAHGRWTVKAAFELKHAKRVLFDGNVIENHWADAQVGFAVLFQGVNQGGSAPWSKVQDITMTNNVIKNSTSGFNLLSRVTSNGATPTDPMRRVLLKNNLFLNVGRDPVSGARGIFVQLMSDHEDVSLLQNTFIGASAYDAVMFDGAPSKRLTLFNNFYDKTEYGILGSGFGVGLPSLAQFAPNALVEGNVVTGADARAYPARNFFPAAVNSNDFINAAGGDYTLRSTVSHSANGGTIVGVNGTTLLQAVANTISR